MARKRSVASFRERNMRRSEQGKELFTFLSVSRWAELVELCSVASETGGCSSVFLLSSYKPLSQMGQDIRDLLHRQH